jgi:hypothetical protein
LKNYIKSLAPKKLHLWSTEDNMENKIDGQQIGYGFITN